MKTSTAFKRTKAQLWDGKGKLQRGSAVCYAAIQAGDDVYDIVSPIIQQLLGGCSYLGSWLRHYHGINVGPDIRRYQLTRHAWVDHLIAHYESIGD